MSSPVVLSASRGRGLRPFHVVVLVAALALAAGPALAAGSGGSMPWEPKLEALAESITGPVARFIGVIAIALMGLGVAFSEGGSWTRRGFSLLFGLSVAFTASSFGMSFFGATSGAAF